MPGGFITFEGPDKAGKSTQIRLFCEYLTSLGLPYVQTREPGGCPVSEKIRAVILAPENEMGALCEAFLYAAARSELVRTVIRPALRAGNLVVCDRYIDSSIAYQGYGRELGAPLVRELSEIATECLWPDLTFYFAVDPDIAAKRSFGPKDRLETGGAAFKRRVAEGYRHLYQQNKAHSYLIDGNASIEQVHRQIVAGFQRWRQPCG